MFSKFFIERPRFAIVISFILMIAGGIAAMNLAVLQYPNISPPQIYVGAEFPGADAETLAKTVGIPLEEAVNGVDGMIYMSSTSSNTGRYALTITFETGTDPDIALVKVQNRIQQATPLLPQEVAAYGINADISFSDNLGFVAFVSPNRTKDELFLNEYVLSNVSNRLKRVPGMGKVDVYGAKYSIRVWLDPERLASMGLSVSDVAAAITSQNRQASIGSIGGAPGKDDSSLVYSLTTTGRLSSTKEFEEVILRTTAEGGHVRLKDVATVELGAESYNMLSNVGNAPSSLMALSQAAGSNALDVMRATKAALAEMERTLPEDTAFLLVYDSTEFVVETIKEILTTLLITFALVVLVCYLFFQNWRVTLVPVAAIPISLLATFIGLLAMGFSINILTLFGLVLVVGTVVDNAIIVVERVMFIMERDGKNSFAATYQAMKDVTGPMTATTLVFLAIFVPVAFMGGITGEIYRQFAVTVSFSVVSSLIVALTLSPAMCAYLLHKGQIKPGRLFAWFTRAIETSANAYVKGSMMIARKTIVTLTLFAVIVAGCWGIMGIVPTSFVPDEDQGSIFATVQLPEGASMNRTVAVVRELTEVILQVPGIQHVADIIGYSLMGDEGENVASLIINLDHWSQRKDASRSVEHITNVISGIASKMPEARINVFSPPAIPGLGIAGGLDIQLLANGDNDPQKLAQAADEFIEKLNASPEILHAFTGYTANTPHIYLNIDRGKAEMLGITVGNVFDTLQSYFGTAYVNDVNIGAQVNKVILQSDWAFRNRMESIGRININGDDESNVPMQSIATLEKKLMPRSTARYNLFSSASINALASPGFSTGQAMARAQTVAQTLPPGYRLEWSGMTYQEQQASGQVMMIIGIALLFGYLFLVAQYESWTVPLAVMLSLPVAFLGALLGILVMRISMSIYTQLGILMLVGLAAKNAILIVEFAKELHEERGLDILDAAAQAARERFRSVLMTAFTCVFGVLPMLFASGAGAASRLHVGTTMCFGMAISTVFGIFIIPGLYVVLQSFRERVKEVSGFKFEKPDWQEEV
jgi:The (Largely Gram-negative Bacterial) Hydrophobe/Amphiphile Efflux-1 (HAE1) Family